MFVQSYWHTQSLNTEIEYDLESYKEAYTELKRMGKFNLMISFIFIILRQ